MSITHKQREIPMMPMLRSASIHIVVCAIVVSVAAVSAGVELTATSPATAAVVASDSQQMTAVGYSSVSLGINGAPASVVLDNGTVLPMPNSEASQLQVASPFPVTPQRPGPTPDTLSEGNCGDSWLYFYANGNSGITFNTGYNVYESIIGLPINFYWEVDGGNESYNRPFSAVWSGGLALYWSTDYPVNKGAGWYLGDVFSGSYVLGTKNACYTGGPTGDVTTH